MTDQPEPKLAEANPSVFAQPAVIGAILGALVVGLVIGVAGAGIPSALAAFSKPKVAVFSAKTAIDKALTGCGMTQAADGVTVSDGGKTLTIDGEGQESDGLPSQKEFCLLNELKMPDSIRQDMGQTRALDGAQTATWPHWGVTWRYHPDDGLDSIVTASR